MKKLFLLALILISSGSAQAIFRDRYYYDDDGEYVERRGGLLGGIVNAAEDVVEGAVDVVDNVTVGGRDYPVHKDAHGDRYYVRRGKRVYLD